MNNTQSIIVYRNPAEAAFWESGMLIPLLGGLGTGFLLFVLLMWIAGKATRDWRGPSTSAQAGAGIASVLVAILVFKYLML